MTSDVPRTSVVVGICTYRRPEQLEQLLDRLARRAAETLHDLQVLVVDDDPDGGARSIAEVARDVPVTYRHCGSANLSTARNTVLDTALSMAEQLVIIDDDCLPSQAWVDELVATQLATGADIVTGRRVYRTRPEAPAWLSSQPFCEIDTMRDGEEPDAIYTANLLLRTAWLRESRVRFRVSLGTTGGEDMTFMSDARRAGAVLRACPRSVVHEPLTPDRECYRYHVHRQFWLGNNMVVINRQTHRESPARLLLRGLKRVVASLLAPLPRVAGGRPPQFRWSLAYAAQGVGLVVGVFGVTVDHRS